MRKDAHVPEERVEDRTLKDGRGDRALTVLQAGRAAAALAIVAYHGAIATRDFGRGLPPEVSHLLGYGTFGVDFFFVLSGFIIRYAHAGDPSGLRPARAYAIKRVTRIYVPYLPVALGLIVIYLALPTLSASQREWSLLTSLTLLPTGAPPALAAAWTLVHEMMFYALFLASYALRGFRWIVAAWVGVILLGAAAGWTTSYAAPTALSLFAPINIAFVAGMAAAWAVDRVSPRVGLVCLSGGALALSALFALSAEDPAGLARVPHGIALALVVVGAVRLERAGRLAAPAWLVGLGNASYAIYLVHNPVASFAARLAARSGILGSWLPMLAFCIALGLACGLAYHRGVERPALAFVRRRWGTTALPRAVAP